MTTHYIDSTSGGNQYYFNSSNAATTSQAHQTYNSSATPTFGSSGYSNYPMNVPSSLSSNQQIRLNDSYSTSQSYQSVGGFNKNVTRQRYHSPSSPSPTPQVRASVRVLGSQDLYHLQSSPQSTQISPQQHHFQFDSRQQPGRSTGPAVVYQTPGAAQYTHHNVDLWTEGPSQGSDHYVQAQRVSVRPVSTGSPQQSHSVSPQRHQDHLQQYYSQLTPEQHHQLLRQQQSQRQQEQNSSYEQQHRVTVQQISPSSTSYQQQQQQRSTASFSGGEQHQQGRSRSETDPQRQDELDYHAAQRQMTVQRVQQDDEQSSHPVGIRNLMSKFNAPTSVHTRHPRSRSSSTRQYSSSNYTSHSGPGQTTSSRTYSSHSMTYSALPKPHEPPVNSVEYFQMQQLYGSPFTNIQQAAAPPHIQHTPTDLGPLRDRFKTGSLSEDYNRPQAMNRQPQYQPPPPKQQMQRQTSTEGGSSLLSLRNQYVNRTKESSQDELPPSQPYNISRTIVGEDIPRPKQQQQAPQGPPPQVQPPPQVLQKQPEFAPQIPRQQTAAASQPQQQQQQPVASASHASAQEQKMNADQQAASSEVAPPSTTETTETEPGTSSF